MSDEENIIDRRRTTIGLQTTDGMEANQRQLALQSKLAPTDGFVKAVHAAIEQCMIVEARESGKLLMGYETKHACGKKQPSAVLGGMGEIGDVWAHLFCIGKLNFTAIDYGDRLTRNGSLRQIPGECDPSEESRCTIVALAASLEWKAQLRRNRIHSQNRVLLLASTIRGGEIAAAGL